jgi:hypothetical protein
VKLIPDTNLVFVHIAKTGGMSVTRHLGLVHLQKDHLVQKSEGALLGPDYVRFCVVREPMQRFVSAYKYALHMLAGGRFRNPIRDLVEARNLGSDINAFVRAFSDDDSMLQSDVHFRPQIWWLRRARPQIILRLETIEADIAIIDRLLGRPQQAFPRVNEMKDAAFADVNVTLDEASLAFCRAFYREDFIALGYRKRAGAAADLED